MRIAVSYNTFTYSVNIVLHDKKKSEFFTGVRVLPGDWDPRKKCVRESNPDHENLNKQIRLKYREVESTILGDTDLKSIDEIRSARKAAIRRGAPLTLNDFWNDYIHQNFKIKTARYTSQVEFLKVLNSFDADIGWVKVNKLLIHEFDDYLVDKGYADSTCKLYHQFLKASIRESERFKLINPNDNPYNGGLRFHYQTDTNNAIYLDDSEIKSIYGLMLKGREKIIRDYFIISCFTSLDFSTIKNLSRENVYEKSGRKFIRIQRIKTKANLVIPVHPIVAEILNSYDYSMPEVPVTLRQYNNVIKDIAKAAGINQFLSVTVDREEKLVRKYELVSSHTGRRSAATNMYLAGIKPLQIRMITGHRTEEAFLKYIRISKQHNADLIADSKYFI